MAAQHLGWVGRPIRPSTAHHWFGCCTRGPPHRAQNFLLLTMMHRESADCNSDRSESIELGTTSGSHRDANLDSKLERTGTLYLSQCWALLLLHHLPIQSIFQNPEQVPTLRRSFLPQQDGPLVASPVYFTSQSPPMTALSQLLPLFTQCSDR